MSWPKQPTQIKPDLAKTPVNFPILSTWLHRYKDIHPANSIRLYNGFKYGFRIQYTGPPGPRNAPNLKSAHSHPQIIKQKLQKEIDAGRLGGPFITTPFASLITSPIGLVPKTSETHPPQNEAAFRLIHHLSYPDGKSVNHFIPSEQCTVQYNSFDSVVAKIHRLGKGAYLSKFDIKSAFRLLPVSPTDFPLLGIQFQGCFYFDKSLPFGCSISCSHVETFSTFLQWAITQQTGNHDISHYLDDYIVAAITQKQCNTTS